MDRKRREIANKRGYGEYPATFREALPSIGRQKRKDEPKQARQLSSSPEAKEPC
jgi:hypothetical protein